jgi:hypothetical protein
MSRQHMRQRLFTSLEEKEKLFHSELVKYGVKYELAAQAAKILVSGKPDELLTQQEIQLVEQVCREWLTRHKSLSSLLRDIK